MQSEESLALWEIHSQKMQILNSKWDKINVWPLLFTNIWYLQTYTTASGYGDLYGIPARLTDILQVKRLVRSFVLPAVDHERSRIDGNLHTRRPIRIHLPIFMVEAFKLQLQIRPPR